VIVVRADDDCFIGQRTFPFQHGDDVLHVRRFLHNVDLAGCQPASQLGAAGL
jgi:hypothetical protein